MAATDMPVKQPKPQMHSLLLSLRPTSWEQQYFAQLEGLDLLNCLITPIFFASTLSRWPRSFLSTVYCVVLAIKGYQIALLLLPAARQNRAHSKARYWIILAERVLRQFVATPALGRGPRFIDWMRQTAAADPGPATAFKLAMLVSGVTHAFWNAFCLPLDITSQVAINMIFFCIHFPATVCQVAYPIGMLVRHKPQLVCLQWGLEQLASTVFWPVQLLLQAGAAVAATLTGGRSTCVLQQPWQVRMDALALVAEPPGRAPDLSTPAGRLVLALAVTLMLMIVLYVPLLFAWRLERHLKARFMATVMQRAGLDSSCSSPSNSPTAKAAGSSSSKAGGGGCSAADAPASKVPGSCSSSSGSKAAVDCSAASKCGRKGQSDCARGNLGGGHMGLNCYISPGPSFPLFPTEKGVWGGTWAWQLGCASYCRNCLCGCVWCRPRLVGSFGSRLQGREPCMHEIPGFPFGIIIARVSSRFIVHALLAGLLNCCLRWLMFI